MTLQTIIDDFEFLEDWEDKYGYIIDLGRNLEALPEEQKTPENLVPGCTSQVWLVHNWGGGKLELQADSDALIVRGLDAIVLAAYNGKTAAEIKAINITNIFADLGLDKNLSPNRRNGFVAMVEKIQNLAEAV